MDAGTHIGHKQKLRDAGQRKFKRQNITRHTNKSAIKCRVKLARVFIENRQPGIGDFIDLTFANDLRIWHAWGDKIVPFDLLWSVCKGGSRCKTAC